VIINCSGLLVDMISTFSCDVEDYLA